MVLAFCWVVTVVVWGVVATSGPRLEHQYKMRELEQRREILLLGTNLDEVSSNKEISKEIRLRLEV